MIINPELLSLSVLVQDVSIVVPKSHPLATRKKIKLVEFGHDSFILFPRIYNPYLYDQIIATCQQVGFSPNIAEEVSLRSNAVSLVAAEMGITFLSESLCSLCGQDVVYKHLAGLTPQLKLVCGWRSQNASACLPWFLEVVESNLSFIS